MSTSFSFGDEDQEWTAQENFAEYSVDAGQTLFSDAEEGESPFQALFRDEQEHDGHLYLSMPQNACQAMTNSSPSQPDQRLLRIVTPPPQPGQTVHHLHQCMIDHSGYKVCSVKGVKRRVRGPDWSVEEKCAYLKLKLEAQLGAVKGKDWDFISHNLEKRHGFRRCAKSCEDLWGTLRKAFKLIRGHEKNYWEMDADGRARNKLPKSFPESWFHLMESILAAQELRSGKNSKMINCTKTPANEGDDDRNNIHPGQGLEDLQIKQLVGSALQRLRPNLGDPGSLNNNARKGQSYSSSLGEEEHALFTLVSQSVEVAVKSVEDAVIEANFGPRLVKKCIMDALHSSLVRPVASALCEVQHQEELEVEARLKAIEETRRALDREEKQIKRQRLGRVGPSKRLGKKFPVTSAAEGTGIER